MIRLARIFSDGCIFQRNKKVRIWGWTDKGSRIWIRISDMNGNQIALHQFETDPMDDHRFDAWLSPLEAGGPYVMCISNAFDEEICIRDIYVGEVIHLAGQSNIEFPMARVRDTYPEEFEDPDDPLLRTFKVQQKLVFTAPLTDAETGAWVPVTRESLPDYSALGYFLAKKIRAEENVPVGLVNTTLGGSFVESWMSREMLERWPELIAKLDACQSETFVEDNFREGMRIAEEWDAQLAERDRGLTEEFMKEDTDLSGWDSVSLPALFSAAEQLKGFSGCVWLKKKFTVPADMAGKECMLWLGTMTDADETFVNGEQVGVTYYKYPPRRYHIRAGLLHEGENDVTIRLKVEKGHGRVTPGKLLAVWAGEGRRTTDSFNEGIEGADWLTDLSGEWKMRIGCEMPEKGGVDFIIQEPAGQFNGMLAPVWNYTSGEVVWYQGESDSDRAALYMDKFRTLVESWRSEIGDAMLPFYVVVLPEYDEMVYEKDENPDTAEDWWKIQQVQRQSVEIPSVYPVEISGSGELNDLHPQRKKIAGENVANAILANKRLYG